MRIADPRGTWVKVDGLTRVGDVHDAVDAGVSAVGFIFALSPRQVSLGQAAKMRERVPDGVCAFGVFDSKSPNAILRNASALELGGVQFPADTDLGKATYGSMPENVLVLRTVRVRGPEDLTDLDALECDAVHLDAFVEGQLGGTGHTAPWDDIEASPPPRAWVLSGGLKPDNVAEAVARLGPDGVDVSSGVEAEPGIKDAEKLHAFVQAARSDRPGR